MEQIPFNQKQKKKQSRTAKLFNSFSKKNPFANKEIFSLNYNPRRHGTFHKKSKFTKISLILFDDLNNSDLIDGPSTENKEKNEFSNNRISMINPVNSPKQLRKSSLPEKTQKPQYYNIFDDININNDSNNSSTEIRTKLKISEIYDNDDSNKNYIRMNSHQKK